MSGSELTAASEYAAAQHLLDLGCTDGLPVVVPTPDRVEALIMWSGRDPDVSLGRMPPTKAEATVRDVAVNSVMAGCAPEHFPLVLSAIEAVLQPEFDLAEVQVTTHNCAPLVIVNGPVRQVAGVHSGPGALGPGFCANATIGRALRLTLMNVGGAVPGKVDMALLGHPGKFTYCLAEAEEASPFEPFHVSRGFTSDESTVTVVAVEAPHSVVANPPHPDSDANYAADQMTSVLAATLANVGSNNAHVGRGSQVVVLNPLHAQVLAASGRTRTSLAEELWTLARNSRERINVLEGPWNRGRSHPGDDLPALERPEDLVVLVAGGEGPYSAVMPSWGSGPHGNLAVTRLVRDFQRCAIQ